MSTTQACAHVCTAKPVLHFMQAGIDYNPTANNERRFWIVDTRAPSDVPPPNALQLTEVLLPEVLLPTVARSQSLWWVEGGDGYYFWGATDDRFSTHRHFEDYELLHFPHRAGKWTCRINRKDEAGMEWNRVTSCALDDFGWLVEVPTC